MNKISSQKLILVGLVVSVVVNLVLVSMWLQARNSVKTILENPQQAIDQETTRLVQEVSALIDLPTNILPRVATVGNATALQLTQPFFNEAQDGDKVLMYVDAVEPEDRKAYLYRPSTKQLVNVAPVTREGELQSFSDEFVIQVLNGTGSADLENQMKELLARVYPNATVSSVGVAQGRYERSQLVNVSAEETLADTVAQRFGVQRVEEVGGETIDETAEMVLILGGTAATQQP